MHGCVWRAFVCVRVRVVGDVCMPRCHMHRCVFMCECEYECLCVQVRAVSAGVNVYTCVCVAACARLFMCVHVC